MFDQPPPNGGGGPSFGRPMTPPELYELLKADVRKHYGNLGREIAGCSAIQIIGLALKATPSDLSPLLRQDPAVHAVLDIGGRQLGALCHRFGDGAGAAKAMLILAIEESFDKSRGEASSFLQMAASDPFAELLQRFVMPAPSAPPPPEPPAPTPPAEEPKS